ncbi:MAG TPA: hypothetical protein VJY34_24870 [Roseiarcus sp.]|nr:hypothetical protein [Roseiarcus sp.]
MGFAGCDVRNEFGKPGRVARALCHFFQELASYRRRTKGRTRVAIETT